MTQEELQQADASGKVSANEPATTSEGATTSPTLAKPSETSIEQYIPILNQLQSVQRYLLAHPTFTPQTFQDQIQFVFDGSDYWIDTYFNGSWRKTKLDNAGFPQAPAQGDIVYFNGTTWVRLPAGLVNQVLKTKGSGANPIWEDGLGYQLFQFNLPANTITDQTHTETLNIRPKVILAILVGGSSQICWAWAVYAGEGNTMLTNELAIPIPNNPAPLAGGFLQLAAQRYVLPPSVTANQITFHWQNNDPAAALTANFICMG